MTVTAAALELTEGHRMSQVQLRSAMAAELTMLMPMLDTGDIAGSWPQIEPLLVQLVATKRAESVAVAQEFYSAIRRAEGVTGTFAPVGADALPLTRLVTNLRIAGPKWAGEALYRGDTSVAASTLSNLEGEVARNVLNGGRSATINTTIEDRKAVGWIRITDGNPCAFCAMLASRGPVYKSARSAVAGNYLVTKSGTGKGIHDFRAHPRCGCTAKPVYSESDPWPDRNQNFRERWDEATKGHSGNDALNAFRRALDAA